jgi:hypothetical protein
MKQILRYILLIITVFSFGKLFSQSLITAEFIQMDSICDGTTGIVKLSMYDNNYTNTQKVSHFRLMFEYDATVMQIENITTENTTLGNFKHFYPTSGQCIISDSLTIPTNFYVNPPSATTLIFIISFNGIKKNEGTAIRFISDSCYFKTEEEEKIDAICNDSLKIRVHSGHIKMEARQKDKPIGWGCSYEAKGQAKVTVWEGTPPYKYLWSAGMQNPLDPTQVGQLSEGEVTVRIIDGNGCLHDTTIMIETLRAPKIDWAYETLYSEMPEFAVKEHPIHFYVTNFDDGYNWEWKMYYTNIDTNIRDSLELGDRKNQTDFNYVFLIDNDYEVQLTARSLETGCDTSIVKMVKVDPAQLEFKNVVTPNNNRFKVLANGSQKLRDVFVSHVLIIQDRTGRKVYETKDFPDDGWDGGGCPNGTYYFILKAKSTRKEYKYQGTLVILGGNG